MKQSGRGLVFLKWALGIVTTCVWVVAIYVKIAIDFSSESPWGTLLGILTLLCIMVVVGTALVRRVKPRTYRWMIPIHISFGLNALALALCHWEPRGRNISGIASLSLLFLLCFQNILIAKGKMRILRKTHLYLGYTVLLVALFHGITALIGGGN